MRFADILNKKKRVKKRQRNFSDMNIDQPRGVEETKEDNEQQNVGEDITQDDEVGQRTVVIKPTKIKKLSRKIILNTKPRVKKDTDPDDKERDVKSVVKRNIPSPIGVIQTGPLSSIQIKDEKI